MLGEEVTCDIADGLGHRAVAGNALFKEIGIRVKWRLRYPIPGDTTPACVEVLTLFSLLRETTPALQNLHS